MSPPTYSDLGKSARDIFSKGYDIGSVKLDVKTKAEGGMEISAGGNHCLESGKINANLETKYKCKDYGLTLTEKLNTDNCLNTDIAVEDKLAKGLKLQLCTSFFPMTGKKKGTLKATYKAEHLSITGDSTLVTAPVLNASAVAHYNNLFFGYQGAFDTAKSMLTKNNVAAGYTASDMAVHTYANDGSDFGASIHHKLGKGLEGAVDVGFSSSSNTSRFGLGCKYALDRNSSLRAKVNNQGMIGLGYQHRLRDGVTLTLSTLVNGKNPNGGGHKIGLSLELGA